MCENETKSRRLYYHKTDGGAEYLCSTPVPGTTEGMIPSPVIIRLDGGPGYVCDHDRDDLLTAADYFSYAAPDNLKTLADDCLISMTVTVKGIRDLRAAIAKART